MVLIICVLVRFSLIVKRDYFAFKGVIKRITEDNSVLEGEYVMSECPKCGTHVPPGKIMCPNCDHILDDTIEASKKKAKPVSSIPKPQEPVSVPETPVIKPSMDTYAPPPQPIEVTPTDTHKVSKMWRVLPGQGIGIIGFKGVGKTVYTISMLRAFEKHGYTAVIDPPEGEAHIHRIIDEIVEHERLPKTTEGFTKFNVQFKLRKFMGLYKDSFDVNISDAQGEIMKYMAENSYPFEEVRRQAEEFFAFLRRCKSLICIINLSTLIPPEGSTEPGHFFDLNMLYRRLFVSMARNNVRVDRVAMAFTAADMFNRDAPRAKKEIIQMALDISKIKDEEERQERLRNLKNRIIRERVLPEEAFNLIVNEEFFETIQFLKANGIKYNSYKVFPLGRKIEKFPEEKLAPECREKGHTCGNCIRIRYRRLIPKNVIEPLFWALNRSEAPIKNILLTFPLKKVAILSVLVCLLGWSSLVGYRLTFKTKSIYESEKLDHYARIEKLEDLKESSSLKLAKKLYNPFDELINKLAADKLNALNLKYKEYYNKGNITVEGLEEFKSKYMEFRNKTEIPEWATKADSAIKAIENEIKYIKTKNKEYRIENLMKEAKDCISKKKYEEASDALTEVLEIKPDHSEASRKLAEVKERIKEGGETISVGGKKEGEKIDEPKGNLSIEQIKIMNSNAQEAINDYDFDKASELLGKIMHDSPTNQIAIVLEELLKSKQKEVNDTLAKAEQYKKNDNFKEALVTINNLIEKDKKGNLREAAKLRDDILKAKKVKIASLIDDANAAFDGKNYPKAKTLALKVQDIEKENLEAKGLLDKINNVENTIKANLDDAQVELNNGRYKKALESISKVERLDPNNQRATNLKRRINDAREEEVKSLINDADNAIRNQNLAEAKRHYNRLNKIDPSNSNTARIHRDINDLEDSIDDRETLLQEARNSYNEGKYDTALSKVRQFLNSDRENASAKVLEADIMRKIKERDAFFRDEIQLFNSAESERRTKPASVDLILSKYQGYIRWIEQNSSFGRTNTIDSHIEKVNEVINWYNPINRNREYIITLEKFIIDLSKIYVESESSRENNMPQWYIKNKQRFRRLLSEATQDKGYWVKVYVGVNKTEGWTLFEGDTVITGVVTTKKGKTWGKNNDVQGSGWYHIKPLENTSSDVYVADFSSEKLIVPWRLNQPICFRLRLKNLQGGSKVPGEFVDFYINGGSSSINMVNIVNKNYITKINGQHKLTPDIINLNFTTSLQPIVD